MIDFFIMNPEIHYIDNIDRVSFRFDSDESVTVGGCDSNDIKINASGQYVAVLVIRVVASYFRPAGRCKN